MVTFSITETLRNNASSSSHKRRRQQQRQGRRRRVILLLDLDCFYAQCECIRLGFDASTTALALLQWNSVLAVTYPARHWFQIQRGDSWQAIHQKVQQGRAKARKEQEQQGQEQEQSSPNSNQHSDSIPTTCHAIHVPLLTTWQIQNKNNNNNNNNNHHQRYPQQQEQQQQQPYPMKATQSSTTPLDSNIPSRNDDPVPPRPSTTRIRNPYKKIRRDSTSSTPTAPPLPSTTQPPSAPSIPTMTPSSSNTTTTTATTSNHNTVTTTTALTSPDPHNATTTKTTSMATTTTNPVISSLEEEYRTMFDLTETQQMECRRSELGVRRHSGQGKASLERYRIASARIFQVVQQFLQSIQPQKNNSNSNNQKHPKIILERASIDEFYLDVTDYVQMVHNDDDEKDVGDNDNHNNDNDDEKENHHWNPIWLQQAKQVTVPIGPNQQPHETHRPSKRRKPARSEDSGLDPSDNDDSGDDEDDDHDHEIDDDDDDDKEASLRLWRGAAVAWAIRQRVYDTLGFTLTAGIGENKTIAKLTASYGKPNGQAITLAFPLHRSYLLQQTKLHKCRNLGGKVGKLIQQALLRQQQEQDSTFHTDDDDNDDNNNTTSKQEKPQPPTSSKTAFTVACIARDLSLAALRRIVGNAETAHWIFELSAYGIDPEPVASKQTSTESSSSSSSSSSYSATKSLTAFKSLPNSRAGVGHSLSQAQPWIHLLATDLVTRVQRNATRHGHGGSIGGGGSAAGPAASSSERRYPKTCTLHYTKLLAPSSSPKEKDDGRGAFQQPQSSANSSSSRVSISTQTKSVRIPFPSLLSGGKKGRMISSGEETTTPSTSTTTLATTTTTRLIETLCASVVHILQQREDATTVQFTRIGFTATDFVMVHPTSHCLDHYFGGNNTKYNNDTTGTKQQEKGRAIPTIIQSQPNDNAEKKRTVVTVPMQDMETKDNGNDGNDKDEDSDDDLVVVESFSSVPKVTTTKTAATPVESHTDSSPTFAPILPTIHSDSSSRYRNHVVSGGGAPTVGGGEDPDLLLAKSLQAKYDREDRGWQRLEQSQTRSNHKTNKDKAKTRKKKQPANKRNSLPPQRNTIDSFFFPRNK